MFNRNANGVRAIHGLPTFAPTPLALGLNENIAPWTVQGMSPVLPRGTGGGDQRAAGMVTN